MENMVQKINRKSNGATNKHMNGFTPPKRPPTISNPVQTLKDRLAAAETQRALFTYAIKLSGNGEIASDLVQETFLKALQALDDNGYREQGNFDAWLGTILRNDFLSRCRKAKREEQLNLDVISHPSVPAPQEAFVDFRKTQKAITALPIEQQNALLAIFIGHTYDETAAAQNV